MNRVSLCVFLSFSLFILSSHSYAETKMLDNNAGYCQIFYNLNGGDVPDSCPKRRGGIRKPRPIAFSRLINFEFGSSKITSQSEDILNKILAIIQHEKMRHKIIRIGGHTDIIGSSFYNQGLSERRALAVKRYFVRKGIKADRIQSVGYGFNRLFDQEHPDDGINRRVEFANLSN